MNTASYRDLQVLEELSSNSAVTQRHLSQRLQVALGLANLLIRRLVKKGHVKVVGVRRNRIRYLLTPKGIAEKTRLTYEYLEFSLFLYRRARQVLERALGRVASAGGRRVVCYGTGEIAEIAYLTIKELGLELAGVIDRSATRRSFLGHPVVGPDALATLAFDCIIVSALDPGFDELQQGCRQLGIPEEKVIVIAQDHSTIEALPPGLQEPGPTLHPLVHGLPPPPEVVVSPLEAGAAATAKTDPEPAAPPAKQTAQPGAAELEGVGV